MKPAEADDERFAVLVLRHLDGSASEAERADLAEALRASAVDRDRFVALARQDSLLGEALAVEAARDPLTAGHAAERPAPTPRLRDPGSRRHPRARQRSRPAPGRGALAWAALLALAIAGAGAWMLSRPAGGPPIATLAAAVDAQLRRGPLPRPATVGMDLLAGDGLATGLRGSASVALGDGTRLDLGAATRATIRRPAGLRVELADGRLAATVRAQPAGRPLVIATDLAEAEVLGTVFDLRAERDRSTLAVTSGRVRFTNIGTGASLVVEAGQGAIVDAAGGPRLHAAGAAAPTPAPAFVLGIDFNGPAVTIDGQRWLSHQEAEARGMRMSGEVQLTRTEVQPSPPCPPDVATMLNCAVFAFKDFGCAVPLPPGRYALRLWVMENHADRRERAFAIAAEGRRLDERVGQRTPGLGLWEVLGPFPVEVRDGALDLAFIVGQSEPHVMGLALERLGD